MALVTVSVATHMLAPLREAGRWAVSPVGGLAASGSTATSLQRWVLWLRAAARWGQSSGRARSDPVALAVQDIPTTAVLDRGLAVDLARAAIADIEVEGVTVVRHLPGPIFSDRRRG